MRESRDSQRGGMQKIKRSERQRENGMDNREIRYRELAWRQTRA